MSESKEQHINTREFMQNRELSWLRFDERVLAEAQCDEVPLYEKLKFIAIFTSNLDEFFMVRVGSLFDLSMENEKTIDNKTGMTPIDQLVKIYAAVEPLYKKKDHLYDEVSKRLKNNGVSHLKIDDLKPDDLKYVKNYFENYIQPILSPQVVDDHHPFPFISNKQLCIAARLATKKKSLLGIITVPDKLPAILYLPGADIRYVHTEDIILHFANVLFELYEVKEKLIFSPTRNADINPEDEAFDINEDFRSKMKKLLKKRKRLAVVRLETSQAPTDFLREKLCEKLEITPNRLFISRSPIKMGHVYELEGKFSESQKNRLCYEPFDPQLTVSGVMEGRNMKDVLLSYPFESMEPFLKMLKRASQDPDVLSIKITIYRLAKNAKLIEYLCAAAENGKDVLVLIELRARFDEQNNIDWSERLEEAGCRILYGMENFKVHSKVCLITKREKGAVKYITQIGTGNYNEKTAKQYTDLSLITYDQNIGKDAAEFFKNMAVSNLNGEYEHLWVAPNSMKNQIIRYIEEETKKGSDGKIVIKVNSVTDYDIMCKLQEASAAGVSISMIVRGICCLLPGIPKLTENIKIYSIVGRYLEHSRIYSFGSGADQKMFIASADIMTRNMQKRVEVGCPIYSAAIKDRINHILDVCLKDTVKARVLQSDGTYAMKPKNLVKLNSQEVFMKEAVEEHIDENTEKKSDGFFRRKYKEFVTKLYKDIQN